MCIIVIEKWKILSSPTDYFLWFGRQNRENQLDAFAKMIQKGLLSKWRTIYFYFVLSLRKIVFWRSYLKPHSVYMAPPLSLVLYFNVSILSLILNYPLQFIYNCHCSFAWFCGLSHPLFPLTPFSLRASKWLFEKYCHLSMMTIYPGFSLKTRLPWNIII